MNIPADPFPFMHHRTLAEVARTEALLDKAASQIRLMRVEVSELGVLFRKHYRFNPPPPRDPEASMTTTPIITTIQSMRQRLLAKLAPHIASRNPVRTSLVADLVLGELAEPDAAMLTAGMAPLQTALPRAGDAHLEDLARAVWHAMIERAQWR